MITFTPLSGGAQETKTTPLAYVLQIDDVRILLDCGSPDWCPEYLNASTSSQPSSSSSIQSWEPYCTKLKEYAPTIDLVLLSHGDLQHAGLYAYAVAHWGLRAQTYTTLPVQAMARVAVVEEIESLRAQEDVDFEESKNEENASADDMQVDSQRKPKYVATIKEAHEAFDSINTLRYSQPAHLQGKCQGLTITAFNAGHSLGGTIWKIRSPSSGTIEYAVDLNHLRERHLDGTVLLRGGGSGGVFEALARPDVFITDADRVSNISCRRKDRDAQLIDTVTSTLASRHSVLMPCDASTRLLELLVLLDQHWSYSKLKYPICLISRTSREMLTFVRSMMEWLGGTINKEDVGEEGGDRNRRRNNRDRDDDNEDEALGALSLRFKFVEFFQNPQALLNTYSSKDPKLILAVPASVSHGPSRIIFSEFASVADNVVLLTSRGEDGTFGRTLFNMWNDRQREEDKWNNGRLGRNVMLEDPMTLTMKSKIPLQGVELETYLQNERAAKEKEAAEEAAMARTQRMLEADEGDSDADDSDDEDAVEQTLVDEPMDTQGDGDVVVFAEPGAGGGRRRRRATEMSDWGIETEDGTTKQMLSYDIYLKGNVAKTTPFFKSDGVQHQRFRMFPYFERKRRVDEYGEVLDIGMWLRKGKMLEEEADSEERKEAKRRKEADEELKKAPVDPPSKFITLDVEIQLACRLLFVDMEGLNDGRAVKRIAAVINPRKMIIVHSSSECSQALIDACGAIRAISKDIYSPAVGESIQIGQHTNSFSISLSEELLASTRMSHFEDNEVGFVSGIIASHDTSIIPVLEPATNRIRADESPLTLQRHALGARPITKLPQSTMIGDLKLTVLKSKLGGQGVHTEFAGEGVLLCRSKDSDEFRAEDIVIVRKKADGKVELEGAVSDVYYTVRKAIYNLHAVVAASD